MTRGWLMHVCTSAHAPTTTRNKDVYGQKLTPRRIVTGAPIEVPEAARHLVSALEKGAPRNESKKATRE